MVDVAVPPSAFFVPGEQQASDDLFVAPPREGNEVQPLIGGQQTFTSMLEAIKAAESYVYLASWTFEPSLDPPGKDTSWLKVLADVASRADVRILTSDMDPLGNAYRHKLAWSSYRTMIDVAGRVASKLANSKVAAQRKRRPIEMIVSLHDAVVDLGLVGTIAALTDQFKDVLKKYGSMTSLKNMPLLWSHFSLDGRTPAPSVVTTISVHIASHHQKLCIVDGKVAFCGGVDITAGRAKLTWHDVHSRITGPVVADFERNFVARWNRSIRGFREFVTKSNERLPSRAKALGFEIPLRSTTLLGSSTGTSEPAGEAAAQMQRTLSESPKLGQPSLRHRRTEPVGTITVGTYCDDVERGYRQAISQAQQFIYIENQYFRSVQLASWLITRLREVSSLAIIVVVPAKPEEKDPVITPHGNWLQEKAFESLRRAFYEARREDQFGAFSLRTLTPPQPKTMIYVHSKVMIVDDEFAIIGSANVNPRSFHLDSEANVAWSDRSSVTSFRQNLWKKLLGEPKDLSLWKPEEFVSRWRAIADINDARLKPTKGKQKHPPAQGFVVSYPGLLNTRENALIPEIIVDLHDGEPAQERTA